MYVDSIKAKLKRPAAKVRLWPFKKRVVVFVLILGALIGIIFFLKPGFLLKQAGKIFPNSQIWAVNNSKALYENENPKFKVLLGDPQNPGKPKITYQLKTNPPREITFSLEKIIDSQNNMIEPDFILHPNLETVVGKKPKLIYREIIPGVDLSYQIKKGKGVKEEIVIREVKDKQLSIENIPITFIFEAQVSDDIKPNRNLENIWYFTDEQDNYLWHFEKPFAEDGEDVRGDAGLGIKDQILTEEGLEIKNYELSISVDTEWLSSPNRTYPVIIDPSIIHDADSDFSGTRNRVYDADTGSSTEFKTAYHELPADEHTVGLWHMNEGGDEIHFQEGESPTSSVGMDGTPSDPEASNGKYAAFNHGGTGTCQDYEDFTFDVTENVSVSIIVRGKERSDSVNSGSYAEVNVFLDPTNGGATGTSLGILRYPSYSLFGWNKWYTKNLQASLSSGTRTIRLCYWTEHRAGASDVNLGIDYIKVITTHTPDSSGNGNNGTIHGAPSVNGRLDSGLSFDGSDDYIAVSNSSSLDLSGGYTIEGWIYFSGWGSEGDNPIPLPNNYVTNGIWVHHSPNGLKPQHGGWSTTCTQHINTLGEWTHEAYTWDGNHWRSYQNGILKCEFNVTNVPAMGANWKIGMLANRYATDDYNHNGYIDEVRISNRALTPEEIKANAQRRPYGVYTSQVIDLGSDVVSLEISWSESGVQTGDGETLYSTTNLVGFWKFNEASGITAADSSGQGNNGTLNGFSDTTGQDVVAGSGWTAANKRWGTGALMFNGSDDYVSVPNSSSINFDDSSFTISFWVKPDVLSSNPVRKMRTTWSGYGGYLTSIGTDGTVTFGFVKKTDNTSTASITSTETISTGRWYHVVGLIDTENDKIKIYINGVEKSADETNGPSPDSTQPLEIGRWGTVSYFNGIIDSLCIYSRALSASEILSNYQAGNIEFQTRTGPDNTPDDGDWEAWKPVTSETQLASMDSDQANWSWDNTATYMPKSKSDDSTIKVEGTGSMKTTVGAPQVDANTVALWHFEETNGDLAGNDVFDETTNNIDGEFGGDLGTGQTDGIFGKARSYDGSGDYVVIDGTSLLDLQDMTISCWTYADNYDANMFMFEKTTNGSVNTQYSLFFDTGGTKSRIIFRTYGLSTTDLLVADHADGPVAGQWNHIVATYDSSSGTKKIYCNGKEIANATGLTGTVNTNPAGTSWIGTYGGGVGYPFNGIIDEMRISNVARTAEEIAEAYRAGRDHRLSRTISSTDLSSKTKLPFYVAADRPGTYLEATVGESAYANYEPDANTVGLWHLEEGDQGNSSIIKFTSTNIAAANAYTYWKTLDDATTLATNDTFEYDVYILNNLGGLGGIEIRFTDATYARGVAGWTDQNSLSCHPGANISSYTYGKWYHRKCTVPSGLNGKVIDWIDLVNENDTATAITAYYDNFIIINSSGSIKTTIYTQGDPDYNVVDLRSNASNTGNAVQSTYQAESIGPADRQGGAFIKDTSGNSNNGIPDGTDLTQGKIGKARDFDGSDDYVDCGSDSSLNITDAITIEAWVYNEGSTQYEHIASKRSADVNVQYGLIKTNTDKIMFEYGDNDATPGNWQGVTGNDLPLSQWVHVAVIVDGTAYTFYINGQSAGSGNLLNTIPSLPSVPLIIGYFTDTGYDEEWNGLIDEVRISNTARTADEIRQAYEIGRRTHPVTIDFAAKLSSDNLITGSSDYSFEVDATAYGFENQGDNLYKGDKIIVKENYGGTEYIAQGTVTAVTASSGAVTVASWDSGSTFPLGGYTQYASVFKWQREWFDITAPLDSHLNTTTRITLRITDGSEGRSFWLDDFRSGGPYLTDSSGSAITSTIQKYFQYRVIFSTTDTAVSPSLISVTLDYKIGGFPPIISPSGGGFLSF